MFYGKELWRGVKERPIVYIVFLLTLVLCTIITCVFYRLTSMQMSGVDLNDTYSFNVHGQCDNQKIYDAINRDKVTDITHDFNINELSEESTEDMIVYENIEYKMVYFENAKTFTQQELNSREPLAIISIKYASEKKLNNGDKFIFGGVEFTVIRKTAELAVDVILPSSVKLLEPIKIKNQRFDMKVIGGLSVVDIEQLESAGVTMYKKTGFDPSALVAVVVGIIVLALGAVNVLIAYRYISNKNMKRYLIYKTVGSSNFRIGAAMTLETFIALTVSFFIGIAIEYPAVKPLLDEYFVGLKPLDYLAIFAINAIMVIITLGHRIFSVAKMMPVDKRYS